MQTPTHQVSHSRYLNDARVRLEAWERMTHQVSHSRYFNDLKSIKGVRDLRRVGKCVGYTIE